MGEDLTVDEFAALRQIAKLGAQKTRPSACVARNLKRLTGLKYVSHTNSRPVLTDKGKQTLFIQNCIDALRQLADNPQTALSADVATFLGRKGHVAGDASVGFSITEKGRECLNDINARAKAH